MPGRLELEFKPPALESIDHPLLRERDVSLRVLRLDQVHPLINGNKWFKLLGNLQAAIDSGHSRIVSFGGAWSNHLVALAAAGRLLNLETIGLLRGEIVEPLNPVLTFLRDQGMELHAMSRGDYRRKNEPEVQNQIRSQFGEHVLLPEGGSNRLAVESCAAIADFIGWESTTSQRIVMGACGTGATLAGLIIGMSRQGTSRDPVEIWGVSVLKAMGYLRQEVASWLALISPQGSGVKWQILDNYHCGGYAKSNRELDVFLEDFRTHCGIPVEPVYTGKLFYGLFEELRNGSVKPGAEIIAIHSGGLISTIK